MKRKKINICICCGLQIENERQARNKKICNKCGTEKKPIIKLNGLVK